ncbi:MAG: iron-containing alcohol dehydrogenase [Verrucomicrobiota bacterium]|nr:iron-containing alcohol dehydrogenase [Limisphaera sp.]MDW8381685.1 iron-containing alcohol dehydrogenase [Verrucomicrobiota bacterium]
MPRLELVSPPRVLFGAGVRAELADMVRAYGRRPLLVTGRSLQRVRDIQSALCAAGLEPVRFGVCGEPEVATVRQALGLARQEQCDCVVGVGGGSVLDTAKAVAGLLRGGGEIEDYLEVVGAGRSLPGPGVPFLALPTTGGTGAEMTRNAVLAVPERRVKVSLRSPFLVAQVALVDPELSRSCPPAVTAAAGLDALTQLLEAWVSTRANFWTDTWCLEGLRRVARSLRTAWADGQDLSARTDMALAGLLSGLALSNAGLGAVHGLAGPIGGVIAVPHGIVCGALLVPVIAKNLQVLQSRSARSGIVERYAQAARVLTGHAQASAADLVPWLSRLVEELRVPKLSAYGLQPAMIPDLTERALQSNSMRTNPVALNAAQLSEILEAVL